MSCRTHQPTTRSLVAEFAADVARDLALVPKQLQSKYLYDALGSSLFEAICRLPWYRITRAETELLARHAGAVVAALGDAEGTIVELGCGSGEKLVLLAEALERRGGQRARAPDRHLVAGARAERAAAEPAASRLGRRPPVDLRGRPAHARSPRAATAARCSCCCSARTSATSITPAAAQFLDRIRATLAPGDLLLLGADLVKPERELLLAYDDPLGVTAAFNKNLLVRINRELGGDFDLAAFAHRAVWNAAERRIEMHLVSRADQHGPHRGRGDDGRASRRGERIWTESSYKYEPDGIVEMGAEAGFAARDQWVDDEAGFALTLLGAI